MYLEPLHFHGKRQNFPVELTMHETLSPNQKSIRNPAIVMRTTLA